MLATPFLHIQGEVAAAVAERRAVVALESTVITHGLPRPANLELARKMESIVRDGGAVPATVAVLEGGLHVGLEPDELASIAGHPSPVKVSRRDLGAAISKAEVGGTTVAATMIAAHMAGIQVFATGGIGGVHRGEGGDVSADLTELAQTPVAVVCAGAKAILDLPRTVEFLETVGVPVIGWGTDRFPAFYASQSDLPVSVRAEDAAAIAAILETTWSLGLSTGCLVTVPIPSESAIGREEMESTIATALKAAARQSISGKSLTPFLLSQVNQISGGKTLQANLALLENNARHASELALALAED